MPALRRAVVTLLLIAITAAGAPAEEPARIRGSVRDAAGLPIALAEISPRGSSGLLHPVVASADGTFAFDPGSNTEGRLVVRARGFAEIETSWSTAGAPVTIVLERVRMAEEVTVTAGRAETRLGDTAARVVVLGRDELQATAALTVDDALRQVPGFSLFRRSGSRVANPTAQGASLRGVGPSGASRTLVLLDGIPLNDPFGGWVYWSRAPRAAVERLEVVEGGASDLYGSAALGGVIQALGRTDAPALTFEASGGNEGTGAGSLYAAGRRGDWGARFAGEAIATDGYVLVADGQRGRVDTAAGVRHVGGTLTLDRRVTTAGKAFVRASRFGESRKNGTPLQVNDTDVLEVSGGGDWAGRPGAFSLRAWYGTQTYHQTFTAVAADRASEALTRSQRVPARAGGFVLQWSRAAGEHHAFVAGIEGRRVRGRSDEKAIASGLVTSLVSAGGRERTLAAFATDRISLGPRALLTLGARLDGWSEQDGVSSTTPVATGVASVVRYPVRSRTALSPRASILLRAAPRLRITAAGYGSFRAPTLNELYRSFRVGDTLTTANPALTEERLRGGEASAAWSTHDEGLRLRAVAFLASIEDPVANVTIRATPQLITRERQNLGRTRSRGLTFDADARIGSHLNLSFGYALTDANVRRFAASPDLEGKVVPQVPRQQVTFEARFAEPRLFGLAVQGRGSSRQFEDDQNRLALPGYAAFDARVWRRIGSKLEAFVAVENVTGERSAVGLTPIATLGPPRLFRLGIRIDWNGPRTTR